MDKWTQILAEMVELSKTNAVRGDQAFRVIVAWQRSVPWEARALLASASWLAADAFSRNGISLKNVMVLIAAYDAYPMALTGPSNLSVIPARIREAAAGWGADYVVLVSSGTAALAPRTAQAMLAHEFAHIVLGHCGGSAPVRYWGRFRWLRQFSVLQRQTEADRLVARLGYGPELYQILEGFQGNNGGFWEKVLDGIRKKKLRAAFVKGQPEKM